MFVSFLLKVLEIYNWQTDDLESVPDITTFVDVQKRTNIFKMLTMEEFAIENALLTRTVHLCKFQNKVAHSIAMIQETAVHGSSTYAYFSFYSDSLTNEENTTQPGTFCFSSTFQTTPTEPFNNAVQSCARSRSANQGHGKLHLFPSIKLMYFVLVCIIGPLHNTVRRSHRFEYSLPFSILTKTRPIKRTTVTIVQDILSNIT